MQVEPACVMLFKYGRPTPHLRYLVADGSHVQHLSWTRSMIMLPALQILERALPATALDLMELIDRHAAQGAEHRFAARQLLIIAAQCLVRQMKHASEGPSSNYSCAFTAKFMTQASTATATFFSKQSESVLAKR